MGFAENMRILSNINCGLASATGFLQQKAAGVNTAGAAINLAGNLANGIARNEIAYDMQLHGNPVGNTINMYYGYGNSISNAVGTMGIMNACTPWMFFNSYNCFSSPMMGYYSSPMAGMIGTMGFMGAYSGCPQMFFNSYSICQPPMINNFAMSYGLGYGLGSVMNGFLC